MRKSTLSEEHPTERIRAIVRKKGSIIVVDDKRRWEAALAQLPDGPGVIRFELVEESRSLELNRAYFATLRTIATHLNEHGSTRRVHFKKKGEPDSYADVPWDTDALHEECKRMFNGGESTRGLGDRRMLDYMDRFRAHYAQEWGVEFPTPEAILEDEPEVAAPAVNWDNL